MGNYESYLAFRDSAGQFLAAVNQPMTEPVTKYFEELSANQDMDSAWAQISASVFPGEASIADLLARSPYTNPSQIKDSLKAAVDRGWLVMSGSHFRATEKSIHFTEGLVKMLFDHFAPVEAALSVDIASLVNLLSRLVEAAGRAKLRSLQSYTFARNYEYEDRSPSLLWVRRHLITLNAFRDDCHISAWSEHNLPGNVWEAFSFIWEDKAHTAEKLAEILQPYRSYSPEEYARALDVLQKKGWIEEKEGEFYLTQKGRKVREQAEEKTNQFYQSALDELSKAELKQVTEMILKLTQEISPPEQAAG